MTRLAPDGYRPGPEVRRICVLIINMFIGITIIDITVATNHIPIVIQPLRAFRRTNIREHCK